MRPPWLIAQSHRAPAKSLRVHRMCSMYYSFMTGTVRMCVFFPVFSCSMQNVCKNNKKKRVGGGQI